MRVRPIGKNRSDRRAQRQLRFSPSRNIGLRALRRFDVCREARYLGVANGPGPIDGAGKADAILARRQAKCAGARIRQRVSRSLAEIPRAHLRIAEHLLGCVRSQQADAFAIRLTSSRLTSASRRPYFPIDSSGLEAVDHHRNPQPVFRIFFMPHLFSGWAIMRKTSSSVAPPQ